MCDAVCAADLHLRDDLPECRTDTVEEYRDKQIDHLQLILSTAAQLECPVLVAGDFFHHWNPSLELVAVVASQLSAWKPKVDVIAIPGQHDLRGHDLGSYAGTGLAVLEYAGLITVLHQDGQYWDGPGGSEPIRVHGFPYGSTLDFRECALRTNGCNVALWHGMVLEWPDYPLAGLVDHTTAERILRAADNNSIKLVVTGDNHKRFARLGKDRAHADLINPGSMMRMTADQINFTPGFYVWSQTRAGARAYKEKPGDVTNEHITQPKEREERLESFVKRLTAAGEVGLSFRDNLKRYLKKNKGKVPEEVEALIWAALDK